MLGVVAGVGFSDELHVSPEHHFFGEGVDSGQAEDGGVVAGVHDALAAEGLVLAVLGDDSVDHAGVFQCAEHDGGVLDAVAVVGVAYGAGLGHEAHFGELDSLAVFGEGAHDVDEGLAGLSAHAVDELDAGSFVDGGVGVGHADNGGEAAGDGGGGAACDGFFFFVAGLSEVDVEVDEAGGDDSAGGVDEAGVGGVEAAEGGDLLADNEEVGAGVDLVGRVDEAAVLDECFVCHRWTVYRQRAVRAKGKRDMARVRDTAERRCFCLG